MIRHAFEARTDTLSTWGLLQENCLLLKAEQEQARKASEESTLQRRLREAREARKRDTDKLRAETGALIRRLPQARKASSPKDKTQEPPKPPQTDREDRHPSAEPSPNRLENVPDVIGANDTAFVQSRQSKTVPSSPAVSKPCWFTVKGSGRHIRLPTEGELVLGRFDATFGIPPDVDLALEDGSNRTVSRRHAKVTAHAGYHTIEDTGSRYGVFVNGEQLAYGEARPLKPGDKVSIGNVQMFYDQMPEYWQNAPSISSVRHILIVTPTGRKISLTPGKDAIIGRSDRFVEFTPDIDLSEDGQVASRVSRRHALISWRKGQPYLEDLGSGFGTRLNGTPLLIGQAVPLNPGDHIWLGGCVLAYDVQL